MLAFTDLLKCPHGIFDLDIHARFIGKGFGNMEGLRQKALNLSGPCDGDFIFVGQLFHSQNGNNILKFFILLQNLLYLPRDLIMFVSDIRGIQNPGSRIQWIHCRVNTQLNDLTRQNNGSVQMRKGRCRCRVGQIVCRHIHTLYGGNGPFIGGGDAFLQLTQINGQSRLIPNGRRHTSQKGGNL